MLAVKSMYMEEQPVVKPHRLTMQNRWTETAYRYCQGAGTGTPDYYL